MNQSMIDAAFKILSESGHDLPFAELFAKVKETLGLSDEEANERIGHFYTDLSLSGTFVALTDNTWDLRSRHTYEKVHIDVDAVYSEVEETDNDEADAEEERAYNQSVTGIIVSDEEENAEDEESDAAKKENKDAAEALGLKGQF